MQGDIAMAGDHNITMSHVAMQPNDVVNKYVLDQAVVGLAWKHPVQVFDFRGAVSVAGLTGLMEAGATGAAFVLTDEGTIPGYAGVVGHTGDIVEVAMNGVDVQLIAANVGGFPPAETRVILCGSGATPIGYGATLGDEIMAFPGDSLVAVNQHETVDHSSVLVLSFNHNSAYEGNQETYQGSPETGSWVQFSGPTQIIPADPLQVVGGVISIKAAGISGPYLSAAVNADIAKGVTAYNWGNPSGVYAKLSGAGFTGGVTGTSFTAQDFVAIGVSGTSSGLISVRGVTGLESIKLDGATGRITAESITLLAGATANAFLTSDAFGNATWQKSAGGDVTGQQIANWDGVAAYVGVTQSAGPMDVIGHIVTRETPVGPTGAGATMTSYDFGHTIIPGSEMVFLGGQLQESGADQAEDYSIGLTAGVGGVTRITFSGTEMEPNVRVKVGYRYL
jgi:hypothetical protein